MANIKAFKNIMSEGLNVTSKEIAIKRMQELPEGTSWEAIQERH